MPRAVWPLVGGRPAVEVVLTQTSGNQSWPRFLLADTGAGSSGSGMELILNEQDCLLCGGTPDQPVTLGRAYTGSFPTYVLRIQVPALGFDHRLRIVGAAVLPSGFTGI